jgi:4-amino-4-deoxy-L-arabinose transferase-like glycosyltransferase
MFRLCQGRAGHHALLVAVCAALYLPNLGGPSLWDIDEGNNSECSRTMLESGDWVVPHFNGELRPDKPALLYWLQLTAYRGFGVNEFSARLPSALAALATVLLTYELGRRLFDAATGLLGGLVLASATLFLAAAHFANPDALLDACTVLTFLCFWLAFRGGNTRWLVAAGAAAGLGVLAKGPVAILLPSAAAGLFLVWSRRLGLLWDRRVLWGALACALVFGPWYGWVGAETKAEFLKGFFLNHNLGRYLHPMEGHGGGPAGAAALVRYAAQALYYPLVLLAGLAPWSAFLGLGVWYGLGRRARADGGADEPSATMPDAYRFLWCWIAVYFFFFAFAGTKLPNYILPLYAPAALLVARFLDRWRRGAVEPSRWLLHGGLLCFALVGVVTAVALLIAGGVLAPSLVRGQRLPGVEVWAAAGVLPAIGGAAAWWLVRRQRRGPALAALGVTAIAFLGLLAGWGVAAVDAGKAPRPLVGAMLQDQSEREVRVVCYRYFQPSLVFYSRRFVRQADNDEEALEYLRYPVEVYLFLPAAEWERLQPRAAAGRVVGRHRDLYRKCDVVVVANR